MTAMQKRMRLLSILWGVFSIAGMGQLIFAIANHRDAFSVGLALFTTAIGLFLMVGYARKIRA